MESATNIYNEGAKALSENNYATAIESFNKALKMLEAITPEERGEEGDELMKEAKSIIPQIHLRYGKTLAASGDIDNSMVQLNKAKETAKAYSVEGVSEEATDIIPQLLMANATNNLNAGKLAEAIAGFKKVIELDSNNKEAYLYTAVAMQRQDDEAAAIEAYEKAIDLGEVETAPKRLSVIYLTRSANAAKAKNWNEVYANAKKSNDYTESPNGHKLIGLSAAQLKKYDEAINALECYYAVDPNAKDKNSTLYNLAVCYESKGNTSKACGYYKQLLNDPTYKQMAEYKISILKCN